MPAASAVLATAKKALPHAPARRETRGTKTSPPLLWGRSPGVGHVPAHQNQVARFEPRRAPAHIAHSPALPVPDQFGFWMVMPRKMMGGGPRLWLARPAPEGGAGGTRRHAGR